MKTIITYGTFDLFHQGHYNILKRAKEMGDYLIVGVTSESYDLERGKLNVRDSLLTRIQNVRKTEFADEIIIEEYQGQKINDIQKYDVDTLVIGSDWIGKFDYLKKYCNVVYLERTKDISSTQLRQQGELFNIGIVTDEAKDGGTVLESKYVSGMHVIGVYSPNHEMARQFCKDYQLNYAAEDYAALLDQVDIVNIRLKGVSSEQYAAYLSEAILAKKHVICSLAHIDSPGRITEILQLARDNGVLVCDDVVLAYLSSFSEMIWYLKGDVIGTPVSAQLNITAADYLTENRSEIRHLVFYMMQQILGKGIKMIDYLANESQSYECFEAVGNDCVFVAGIGMQVLVENSLEIIGTKGRLVIPGNWWELRYFKIFGEDGSVRRYGYNIDGTGFRFLLMNLFSMLESKRLESCKIFPAESIHLAELEQRGSAAITAFYQDRTLSSASLV